ncbi:MAG: hypothetical protein IKQ06_05025 [Bacilli bacterium]|nr:hypothetical protein [Bacilli bacterium]MBR6137499.1 hypothetical protein [Bacilli bacterium]
MIPNGNNLLSLIKGFDYAGFLDGASKTLNLVNQAIPIYNQVRPMIDNFHVLKNITSIMNEKDDNTTQENHNSPIFYI